MTYIELMNEFWRQNGFKPFGLMDSTVYMYLLHQCNIRGWQNPFQLQTRDIEFHLSITRKQIGESKNRLRDRGLIAFTQGSRKEMPTYTILGLDCSTFPMETNTETKTATHVETKPETQPETPLKTETKEKDLKENDYPHNSPTENQTVGV